MTAKEVDMREVEMREVKEETKELDENVDEEEEEDEEGEEYDDMAEEEMMEDLKREGSVKEEATGSQVKKVNHNFRFWGHTLLLGKPRVQNKN